MIKRHYAACAFAVLLSVTCFMWLAQAQTARRSKHPYSSDKPLSEPTIFAEGVISAAEYESHPAFTPDGKTLYFLKNSPSFNFWTIVVSHYRNNKWSVPEVAPFSGRYADADPFITADGSRFYFISTRPVAGKQNADLDIWMMQRTAMGWGQPANLGAPVNSAASEWYPTVSANGTLYFGSNRAGGKGANDLYRARFVNGKYAEPENLGDMINTRFNEFEPYIAPDESFLIFMSARPEGLGASDLYISYQRNGAWTKPINLGDKINSSASELSPMISPDGRYFFWTSTRGFGDAPPEKSLTYPELLQRLRSTGNGLGNIYQIDMSALHLER
ncbi:MAG: PD40 domain-containing protein [Pyrinomonadaceae bacterium]|nr:PD40 domain-containing protein [Pyrinomonadaceae bacterium]